MGHSSLLGTERAAAVPAGRDNAALGPGDNSDSGSDTAGLEDRDTDDPVERHPARRDVDSREAPDIGVDRIFTLGDSQGSDGGSESNADEGADANPDGDQDGTDEKPLHDDDDPDLAFVDSAVAGAPIEDDETGSDDDDDEDEDREESAGGIDNEDGNIPNEPSPRRNRAASGNGPVTR